MKGIMYSNSITICNITLIDIALNPTCSIKLAILILGVLRLPIGLLYMVSKWPICSPHFFPEVFGEPCGVGALDDMTSSFPTNTKWKRIIFPSFWFFLFFFTSRLLWSLEMGCSFPKSSISFHVNICSSEGSPSNVHLY